ncbi:MAG: FlgD immunoglobulin-like domain containing protein [Candidatus Krumholzibacteriia bacterium]
MNRKTLSPVAVALALTAAAWPGVAAAFDHLEITVVGANVVDGHPAVTVEMGFTVLVRAVNTDGSTDVFADFINAQLNSPDVAASLPAGAYLQNGERQFDNVRFLGAGQPVRLRVYDADDGSVPPGVVLINSYNFVDRFTVTVPAGDKFVDQPVAATLTALDHTGAVVRNFGDDVVLDALVGHFSTGPTITVPGSAFSLGTAVVPVTFWGTDPVTRENTLSALNSVIYPGQALAARGSCTVSPLRPGSLQEIVLLLPGEALTPGVSPGKSGTPVPQTSGSSFGGITVYATDRRWNPVEAGPYPSLAWTSSDASAGVALPPSGVMTSNPGTGYTAALIASGSAWIAATASGAATGTSRSDLVINPQGLHHFEFDASVWDPADPQVTTIPFNVRIIARDSNGNVFPLNGAVSLRARIGAADESADYIITNNATFTNGYLDALVQVTKRGFSTRLIVDSGVVGESPPFQVNSGPCEKILVSFPGETWTPGLNDPEFSGNLGSPDPAVAGQVIQPVTLRPVDRYNNLAPGTRNVTLSCPSGYFSLPDHPSNVVSVSNPVDVRLILRTAVRAQYLQAQSSGITARNSSRVTVTPAGFQRLVVEAPGETLEPGVFDTIEDDGKIGHPSAQDAGVPFEVTVFACDPYWNPVSDLSPALPMAVDFSSSDVAAALPGSPQALNDNTSEFQVTLITLADPNQQTIRVDDRASAAWAYATIPIKAGAIDHFEVGINGRTNPTPADPLDPIPDHRAGSSLPNVTIVARDQFGNHIADYADEVTLWVNHGEGVLTPTSVDLGDGYGTGSYRGVWRGSIRITRTGQDVRLFVREETYAKTDSSNAFTVFADARDYADLLLLLPGETHTPGIAPGKVGTPLPVAAGDPVVARVLATDAWWNQVPARPQVHLGSSSYFQMISDNDQPLGVDGSRTCDLFFRTATNHVLQAHDLIAPAVNDTSTIAVTPGAIDRLMLLLPGEAPNPGGPETDGKTGAPAMQTASLQFDVRIRSTDQFWNLVDNSTERIALASDDDSITPTNPLNNGQALVNGEIVMPLFLISTGYVTLAASALDHTDITGQMATVQVDQGAHYQITTPATAFVGPPSTFTMSVALVDSGGTPLADANNWVTIEALKSNYEPASSVLQVTQAQLASGSATITSQAYDTVEDIVVRITDNSGRQSYSSTVQMLTNGLEYVVTVESYRARVGPPSTFPVRVQLRDVDTQTLIDDDRRFDVTVMAAGGGVGQGVWGTTSQRLDHGAISFQQSYTRAENIYVTVSDATGLSGSSPVFPVAADGYKRLQIIAPGEVVRAGIPQFEDSGKEGTPTTQRSGEPFPITVRAVDQYWNLADSTNTGRLRLVASDNSFAQPGNPDQTDVPFINGRRTFNGFLTDEGTVSVTAYDENDLARPSQSSHVPVNPPYEYEIAVPDAASTGPVPGFQVTVKLIDPVTGLVVPTAQNRFRMTALLPNRGAASGTLGVTEAQLIGGFCVLNAQSYSTVEDIIIRVTDDFGREAFSSVIAMETGGLYYAVTVPDTAVVGPPATFPLRVELIDSNTGQRVTTQDRLFDIRVMSARTGLPGTGQLEVAQGMLDQGARSVAEAYSRAEDIFIVVGDSSGVTGISNTCRMLADGFKRIQIVAPGETPDPGQLAGDGKTGTVLTQQAEVPFVLTVRAVDQYWNLVETVADGAITLSSSGGQLDVVRADDRDAPFINGSRDIEVVLGNPGVVAVFATDPAHPTVSSGRVDVPVNEAAYEIVLPEPAVVTAGPPATFALTVRLVNPDTGERINAGNDFTMTALLPSRDGATGTLGIGEGTLTGGEAVIGGQSYGVSEPIVIRVRDARGREAISEVLTVVPEGVRYAVDVPDTVFAGQPFAMTVRRVDIVTGQLVTNDDRTFLVRAFSGNAPRPDPSLTPSGVLSDTMGTTAGGTRTFTAQRYDRAESIYLRISDDSGERFFTETITVLAAPLARLRVWAEDIPGRVLDRPLRPGESALLQVRATDHAGNAVPGCGVNLHVIDGDGRLGSAKELSYGLTVDVNGRGTVELSIVDFGSRDVLLQAAAGEILSDALRLDVTGPPVTSVTFEPEASAYGDGWYVLPTTEITLTATTEDAGGVQAILFDVDVVDPPRPAAVYAGSFTLAGLGLDASASGTHVLRFYAEESSGILEQVRSVTLYTATQLTTDQQITNRPNPFRAGREQTIVLFRPEATGRVTVSLYDLYGDLVLTDQMDVSAGGTEQFVWDGRNGKGHVVANGGYICRIHGNGMDLRRKIAVVK